MAENHRPLRVPLWLWQRYAEVVGDVGRTADLKTFLAWRIDNPPVELGDDVAAPYDFLAKFRVDLDLWELFLRTVADDEGSSEMRRYIWWRVQHPDAPLPGRRVPPLQRWSRRPACV